MKKNNKTITKAKAKIKKTNFGKHKFLKLLIAIGFIYGIFILALYISNPVQKVTVIQGKISDEQSIDGYIIRKETLLSTNMVSDILLTKTEGSRVAKNEVVATYISKTKQDLEKKIDDLDAKIQSAMQEQTNLFSTDTKSLDSQIEDIIYKANNTNNMQSILQYKSQVDALVEKKAKIVGELSPSGSYINQLITQRNSYETELAQSTDYIKTNISGVISTRIDNYENVLTADNLDTITYNQLKGYKVRTDEIVPNNTKTIKIVDNYYCYIVIHITDEHKDKVEVGDDLQVRLDYGNLGKISARVDKIIDEDDGKTIFLKINKNVEKLINYRKISFDIIWWEYEGLKVPNEAVSGEGNNATAVLYKYGQEYVVRVKIRAQNDDYCIITDLSADDIAELNLSSDSVKRSVRIYDELIIK